MTAVPLRGKWRDLLATGVPLNGLTRAEVVKATRQVMLAMHRSGWSRRDAWPVLTDARAGGLPEQIATGTGGRRIAPGKVLAFLDRHWTETAAVAAASPALDGQHVADWLEQAREALDDDLDLSERDRAIVTVALDLAAEHGTSTPTLPVRVVAERVGLTVPTAQRAIARIVQRGEWLTRSTRGDYRTRRASTYRVAPALALAGDTRRGATPPESHPVPESHPPMSHSTASPTTAPEDPMARLTLTLRDLTATLEGADPATVAALVPSLRDALNAVTAAATPGAAPTGGNVVPLRAVGGVA